MSTAPELMNEKRKELERQKEMKEKLEELQVLSDKAEAGNKEARRKLRKVLRECSPEVVARASDFAKRGQLIVMETISAGEPLMKEALCVRLDLMRAEVAGSDPSPLEVLLTEQIVSAWLVIEVLEALLNAQLKVGKGAPRTSPSYLKFIIGWIESYHRRYLASIRELARVRKLQSKTPGVQFNTQINVSGAGSLD